jgi:MFS family permease
MDQIQSSGLDEVDGRRAWLAVVAAAIGAGFSTVPVAIIPVGVFMKPLGVTFGWSRAEIAVALSIVTVAIAIFTPFAGKLIDRVGVRRCLIVSILLSSAALAVVPFFVSVGSIYGFYLAYALIGITGTASGTVAYLHLLSGWFDKFRGLALGLGMSGLSIGAAITPPITAYFIQHHGWEAGYYALAALPLLTALPTALFLVRDSSAVKRPVEAHDDRGWTAATALKTRTFWTLFAVFLLVAMAIHGVQLHCVALVSDIGFSVSESVMAITILFGASIVARIAAGFLLDIAFGPYVSAALFLLSLAGFPFLILSHSLALVYVGVALVGVGAGTETDVLGYLVSRYFGRRAFGQIYGLVYLPFMAGSALGPYFFGLAFDRTKSYTIALTWTGAGLGLACILLLTLPRFEFVRPRLSSLVAKARRAASEADAGIATATGTP